jgi:cysteine desulfurase
MKKVYLDNAATTPIRPEVIQEMVKIMNNDYGNPSSTHSLGRSSKNILELSRKAIAKHFNVTAQEIIFTSGGTESNNWVLQTAVKNLNIKRIISAKVEHHAVLLAVENLKQHHIQIDYVNIFSDGTIDMNHLVELLSENLPTLVSLMHVNNETGVVLDLEKVARICKQYHALFHSDTVQSVGKIPIDLQAVPVDFITASAHKFHGPKGVGFVFYRKGLIIKPLFYGGEQEKGLRPGTEAVHNIAGMAKALEIAYTNLEQEKQEITALKRYAYEQLQHHFPGIKTNGHFETTFYTILNVVLPFDKSKTPMVLFHLDMKGIAVSRGSACQSGSIQPSHVLAEMLPEEDIVKPSIRISFSHYNTKEDIDALIDGLKKI